MFPISLFSFLNPYSVSLGWSPDTSIFLFIFFYFINHPLSNIIQNMLTVTLVAYLLHLLVNTDR